MDTPTIRHRWIALGLIVVLAMALRSCHVANHLASPLGSVEDVFTDSDMHAFKVWAKKIAAGDWLCKDSYHPYMEWMKPIAPLERFEAWWGGKQIYHQTPLYPYVLAVSYGLFDTAVPILALQVVLSALSVILVFDLGRQLLDVRAGFCAAAFAALYAPSIVLDGVLLRASFNTVATLASIWLIYRLRECGNVRWGLLTGVCLAGSYLLRPTGLILLLLGPALLLADRRSRSTWRRWVPALAAGIIVSIAPFAIRNLVVGAPMLTFSTRGPETVLQANCATADPGFMTTPAPDRYVAYMDAGSGSTWQALRTAVDSWPAGSTWSWWLWHEWQKVICVFGDYEFSNNINFYHYRRATWLLGYLPTFGWFVGLGLIGLLLLVVRREQRWRWMVLVFALGALLLGCLLGFALGRYRTPLAVLLTIPAGVTLSTLAAFVSAKQFARAALTTLAAVGISLLSLSAVPATATHNPDGTSTLRSTRTRTLYQRMNKMRVVEINLGVMALREAGKNDAARTYVAAFRDEYLAELDAAGRQSVALPNRLESMQSQEYLLHAGAQTMDQVSQLFGWIGDEGQARSAWNVARGLEQSLKRLRGE